MSETLIRVDGTDNNGIYGMLRSGGNARLIIHIHGMTHSMNHMLEIQSADYFQQQGYDHYRIGLYPRMADARNLADSSLTTHVADIAATIEHFRDRYESIYISAHSLGALCVLILNPKGIKAISLWDPAFDVTHFWSTGDYLHHMPKRKQYQLDYGNVFVVSETLVEEIKNYPDQTCLQLAKQVTTPTQLVIPELSIFAASPHTSPENYPKAIQAECQITTIKKANHTFSNQGNPRELMQATEAWFSEF